MCDPVSLGTLLGASAGSAAAVGTAAYIGAGSLALQASSANKQAGATRKASDQATASAKATADAAALANDQANKKQPDAMGLYSNNERAAKGGPSGTMITGPQGVDPTTLLLGKATLLGG